MADLTLAANTLQEAYDESTDPEIVLSASPGALTIRDNASPIGNQLFQVQNNSSVDQFAVRADRVDIGANVHALTDDTHNVGSLANRFADGAFAGNLFAVSGAADGNVITTTPGFVFGNVYDATGTAQILLNTGNYEPRGSLVGGYVSAETIGGTAQIRNADVGALVGGYCKQRGTGTSLISGSTLYGAGSFVWGTAFNANAAAARSATLKGSSYGSFTQGFAIVSNTLGDATISGYGAGTFCQGAIYCDNRADASLYAYGGGSFVQGFVKALGTGNGVGTNDIHTYGEGAFAQGRAGSTGSGAGSSEIYASAAGAFAQGYVGKFGNSNAADAFILASGAGAFAQGSANASATVATDDATIRASGLGSFAHGSVASGSGSPSLLEATGDGSFAAGIAVSNAEIRATGRGSFAFGDAAAADSITASATNSAQWFDGTNALADSLQVGETGSGGIRLAAGGAPGTPRDGDIWNASNYVYIRSNGVSVKIT